MQNLLENNYKSNFNKEVFIRRVYSENLGLISK